MFTSEKLLLAGFGITLILLNKVIAGILIWWEAKVIKLNDRMNPWVYRIFIIGVGGLFLSIAFLKK